jgi:hypothetical protein
MKTMIFLDNTGFSQANRELFKSIERITSSTLEEISVTSADITNEFIHVNTAIVNPEEVHSFCDGVLIGTTINNAAKVVGSAASSRKVLYLYDLDWMFTELNYEFMHSLLTDERLTVFLRSEDHVTPFYRLCGRLPHGILESFELEKLWNLLEKTD